MNPADWIGVAVGAVGVIFALLAWLSARRSVRISEEQLTLAREQAELQPKLEARVRLKARRRKPKVWILEVEVVNTGKTAAHRVHGWVNLDCEQLGPFVPDPPSHRDTFADRLADRYPVPTLPAPQRSWGQSDFEHKGPKEGGFYQAQVWEREPFLPGTQRTFSFYVQVQAPGEAKIYCHLVSANGAEFEETIRIRVSPDGGGTTTP